MGAVSAMFNWFIYVALNILEKNNILLPNNSADINLIIFW